MDGSYEGGKVWIQENSSMGLWELTGRNLTTTLGWRERSSASSTMARQVESGVLKASMPCPRGHFSPSATDHCARELPTAGLEGLELFLGVLW